MAKTLTQPRGIHAHEVVRAEVQALLDQLAHAVATGDREACATLVAAPALVIATRQVLALDAPADAGRLLDVLPPAPRVRADLVDLERIGERLALATVRWVHLDHDGRARGATPTDVTLRRDDDGILRIRALLMRATEPASRP